MKFWLMKSEPNEFSVDDLARNKIEMWDGVRNYQVRNMMRDDMKVGDMALFYHSNAGQETGVVGEMMIVREAYPDPTQFQPNDPHYDPKSDPTAPRWLCVDVQFHKKYENLVSLSAIKADPAFAHLPLVRTGNRLSVMPLSATTYRAFAKRGQTGSR
jgi:predicted RNA-binding protein with PUA-like domain